MSPVHTAVVRALRLAAATSLVFAASVAVAQQPPSPDGGDTLGEIVVTATKRETTLVDAAAAVSAVTADRLGAGGIQNIGDLAAAVPNLSVGNQFGVNRTFIRGVGLTSIDLGADGAVAFLQNEAMIARPAAQLSGFYDLEQVEVLRGPQGTTYGRGATAGVVNLVTRKPTQELDGYAKLTLGNYELRSFEGAVGGGLGETVAVRVAGTWEQRDGYGRNLFTGNPVDDRDAWALRASLRITPSDALTIDVIGDRFREDDYNYAFHYFGPTVTTDRQIPARIFGGRTIFDVGGDIRDIWSREDAINRRDGTSLQAIVDWRPSETTGLKSVTAWRDFDRFNRDDLGVSDARFYGRNDYTESSRSWSQEFTANWAGAGIDWLAGATYFHENNPGEVRVPLVNLAAVLVASPPGNCTPLVANAPIPCGLLDSFSYLQSGEVTTDAWGAYLEGARALTERLKLTLGARYNRERREGVGSFVFGPQVNVPTNKAKSWGAVTPKLLLEYRTAGNALLYGKLTRGFKSGVINIGSQNDVIDPEFVNAAELGWKSRVGEAATVAVTGFYYDYKDLQVGFVNAQSVVQTVNAAKARNYGVEFEAQGRLAERLSGDAALTLMSAKYTEFVTGNYRDAFRPVDLSGNYLQNAPPVTARVGLNWEVPLGASSALSFRGEAAYSGKVYFTEFNNQDAVQGAYTLLNLSAGWRMGALSATAWVRNLGDELVQANNIITAPLYSSIRVGSLLPPRTFGVTVGYDF